MFESAEIGHQIDKETYDAAVPELRQALLEAQMELRQQARFPVFILISGLEGAGKGETVKLLNEWMDPRMIRVENFDQQSDEELARPPYWRYWRRMPPKGQIGIFFGNWYSQMLQGRVHKHIDDAQLDQAIDSAERFERMLCDEGALIFSFRFHPSKQQMKARFKALEDDPRHSWRLSPLDWQQSKTYDRFVRYGERILAPQQSRLRALVRGRGRGPALPQPERRAHPARRPAGGAEDQEPPAAPSPCRAGGGEHRQSRPGRQPGHDPEPGQGQLPAAAGGRTGAPGAACCATSASAAMPWWRCSRATMRRARAGAIRRMTGSAGPAPVPHRADGGADGGRAGAALPVALLAAHPRRAASFTMFDRSWYGRVLVERVEGFCSSGRLAARLQRDQRLRGAAHRRRAWCWSSSGWRSTSRPSCERFQEREQTAFKRFKITEDDWRNRDKWAHYIDAVNDMVDRTSTEIAPWTLVEANDKRFARVKVLRTLNEALEAAFARKPK